MRIALLVVMLGGCSLYWGGNGGGGDGGVCNYAVSDYPTQQLRDPYTGQCESYGGGTCGPCDPCPAGAGTIAPNWASCSSTCLGRAEASCYATAGCQAEMLDSSYWGCFPVEPGNLAPPTPDCTQFDAYSCSQQDACIAVYTYASTTDKTATKFEKCVNEAAPPPPPPACSTLTTESACLARSDCDAVYNGYDCTCDASGCVCKTETFAYCQAN